MAESTPVRDSHKRCGTCKRVKPFSEFARRSDGHGDGHESKCRPCYRAHRRQRYRDPAWRARQVAAKARWSATNPTYQADYYQSVREDKIAKTAAYKRLNPMDPVRQREYNRAWQERNPEAAREKARRANARRRARLRNLPVEEYSLAQIVERDGARCVLCGDDLDLGAIYPHPMSPTVEHLECLSWSDSAGDVFSNVGAAHARCNFKRGDRPHPAAARKRAELLAALT